MSNSDKYTFRVLLILVFIIIVASLIIFILTPSPISPTKRLFGYITNVYTLDKKSYLEFDRADWLVDSKKDFPASTACVTDGKCTGCNLPVTKPCTPGGYYIRNPDPKTVKYPVASFTKVGTLILNPDWEAKNSTASAYLTLTVPQLEEIYRNTKSPNKWITSTPFDVTTFSGQVIIISQHYIP
jgi:hypothetical protein